jgi:hypothetical protein
VSEAKSPLQNEVTMSLLKQIIDGSLVSNERLMQAREFYAPSPAAASSEAAFAAWTQRVSVQTEPGSARELAGLSNAELEALESEFVRSQTRPRSVWVRHCILVGVVLIALAAAGLAMLGLADLGETTTRTLQAVSAALLLLGLVPLAAGLVAAFSTLHLDVSHGATGLLVGQLDEPHPWIYKTVGLTRHPVADEYRRRTLAARGPLRGADHVVMREMVVAQELLEQVRPARGVAEQLQAVPAAVELATLEPRLVRIGAGSGRGQ